MMTKKKSQRAQSAVIAVIKPGALFSGTPRKVTFTELTHSAHPGWIFRLDYSLETGAVLRLEIRPANEDTPPAVGIQKTSMLKSFPLHELLTEARNDYARRARQKDGPIWAVEVDDAGQVVAQGFVDSTETRARLRASAKISRARKRNPRLTDGALARDMLAYKQWVESGKRVKDFYRAHSIGEKQFGYRRRQAIDRGLWESSSIPRQAGGDLTPFGLDALKGD